MLDFDEGLLRYHAAIGTTEQPATGSRFARFAAALQASEASAHRFRFAPAPALTPSPYEAVRTESAPAAVLAIAIEVSQLLPFSSERYQDLTLYADPIADEAGCHRVYGRDESTLPGGPWFRLESLAQALAWMTDAVQGRTPPFPTQTDAWDASPGSGGAVLEGLVELDLGVLWTTQAAPGPDVAAPEPAPREPGWGRRLCLEALQRVADGHPHGISQAVRAELSQAHQRFVDHLDELTAARAR